jgi:hypothetical protein
LRRFDVNADDVIGVTGAQAAEPSLQGVGRGRVLAPEALVEVGARAQVVLEPDDLAAEVCRYATTSITTAISRPDQGLR